MFCGNINLSLDMIPIHLDTLVQILLICGFQERNSNIIYDVENASK